MRHNAKPKSFAKRAALSASLILGLSIGFSFILGSSTAAAACHTYKPTVVNDDWWGYTKYVHTVPSSSSCHDINISNISIQGRPDINCGTLWVRMYPSSGGQIDTSRKFVCSIIPNGPLQVLASNVKDGTRYRVFYDYLNGFVGIGYSFNVTD